MIQAAPFCLGRRPQQVRHCGVLLSTVSHTSGLADRSPIDPDCGWLCSDKCWLGGSGRMGTERGRRRGGGGGGARRWGALLLSCRPQALQRIGLWLKFMGDRSDGERWAWPKSVLSVVICRLLFSFHQAVQYNCNYRDQKMFDQP